ncbi:hypothetical protein GCM10023350_18730 [Nocardioides endophyticus]|uniref:Htaa domain-containing protein n=1 Tax=Nocardioides endophyticus TaxID=1353775 RepID=A0ABP8YPQ1_9ACTN
MSIRKTTAIAVTAIVASLLTPGSAQAAVPTGTTEVTWNVRTSWVNYVTNPAWYLGFGQGTVTTTASNGGTSSPAPGSATTTWGGTYDESAYSYDFGVASDTGSPRTTTLQGGLDFDLSAHSIDISLTNLRIVDNPSGDEKLRVNGSYDPLSGGPVTLTNVDAFTIAETASGGVYAVTLTAAGAAIFNGGSNGSYAAGDQFGSVGFS